VVKGQKLLELPSNLENQLTVSEAQHQKLNFRVLMANKMVERLASPRVDAETFPMLMAATTSPQGESHTQLK
jgi:hypothetical protein